MQNCEATMRIKTLLLGCALLFYLCSANHSGDNRIVDEICSGGSNDQQCRESVKKCLPYHNFPSDENRKQYDANRCQVLESCLDKTPGVREVYQKYVQENPTSNDKCSINPDDFQRRQHDEQRNESRRDDNVEHRGQNQGGKVDFSNYLAQVSGAALASEFDCCKAISEGKFNANGKVNIESWKQDLFDINDSAAKQAYGNGIDACAASHLACSDHDFLICVVGKCYEATRSH